MILAVLVVVQEDVDVRAHLDVLEVVLEVARVVVKEAVGAHVH